MNAYQNHSKIILKLRKCLLLKLQRNNLTESQNLSDELVNTKLVKHTAQI